MRILLLSRWFWEEHRRQTGEEVQPGETATKPSLGIVAELAEAMAERGHEIDVLSQAPGITGLRVCRIGHLQVLLSDRNKRRKGWALLDKLLKQPTEHRKLATDAVELREVLAGREPYDLLWAQCEEPDGLVTAVARRLGTKLPPIFAQVHAVRLTFPAVDQPPTFRQRRMIRFALRPARMVLANSQQVADVLTRDYKVDPHAIEVGLPNLTQQFLAAKADIAPARADGDVVFLGALNRKKGIVAFLESLPLLRGLGGRTVRVLGGSTEKDPELDERIKHATEQARAHLGERLILEGKVDPATVRERISDSAVVVAPSLFEEFSRVVAEALALGRPVVATETTGAAGLLIKHGAGVVVGPADPADLARGIDHVLADQRFADKAREAAPIIRKRLAPAACAAQLEGFLKERGLLAF